MVLQYRPGIDNRQVKPDRERKSVGAEDTFAIDIDDLGEARRELEVLVSKVWRYCGQHHISGRTVTVKIRFSDFQVIPRSRTAPSSFHDISSMLVAANTLLEGVYPFRKPIRLLGITLSSLGQDDGVEEGQLELRL